jgi:hypothetical protein
MDSVTPPDPHANPLGFGRTGQLLLAACKVAAIGGATVFVALVAMSIVSITGRKLWSAPAPGDVELLQLCSAFAAASFFAYCHLNRGDVHALDAMRTDLHEKYDYPFKEDTSWL